jgi:hypothetical protein
MSETIRPKKGRGFQTVGLISALVILAIYNLGTILGCSTEGRWRQLKSGMTESEVRQIMGRPYGVSGKPGEGRDYYWTWNKWHEPAHVWIVEFSPEGKATAITAD